MLIFFLKNRNREAFTGFHFKRYLPVILMIGCSSLAGCVTTSGKDYALTPTPKLCMDYLMQRGLLKGLKNKGREEALATRGEDCSSYMDQASQLELERKRLFIQGAAAAQKTNMDLFQMGTELKKQGRPYILKWVFSLS